MTRNYTTTGRVISSKGTNALEDVRVSMGVFHTKTNINGDFSLDFEREDDEKDVIVFKKLGYTLKSVLPYTSKGIVKKDVGLIQLNSFNGDISKEITKQINTGGEELKSVIDQLPNSTEEALLNTLNKYKKDLKKRVITTVIVLLSSFGISKITEALVGNYKGTCPNPAKIPGLIEKRNKLVKSLNLIYRLINSTIIAVGITKGLISVFKSSKLALLNIPTPIAIGTPPGTMGGLIFSMNLGMVLKSEEKVKKIDQTLAKFQHISTTVLLSLVMLRTILGTALTLLGIVDKNLEACVKDLDLDEIEPGLLKLIEEAKQTPIQTERVVNGFILGVEKENKQIGGITRKYAVAKNQRGIILLKGESSFSSDEQILMDGLEFYIQTNELKAY